MSTWYGHSQHSEATFERRGEDNAVVDTERRGRHEPRRPFLAQTKWTRGCPCTGGTWTGGQRFETLSCRLQSRGFGPRPGRSSNEHRARRHEAQQPDVEDDDRDEDFDQRETVLRSA